MSRCAVVFAFLLVMSLSNDARAQQASAGQAPAAAAQDAAAPPPPDLWTQLTFGVGMQAYSGGTKVVALSGNVFFAEQFRRIETELSVNVNLSHTFGDPTHHRAASVNSATRWLAATQTTPRLYPMTHIWYEHDDDAGVDLRATAGAGVGSHVIRNASVKLTLEGGVGHTVERTSRSEDYPTIFVSPALRWKFSDRAQFSTNMLTHFNGTVARDMRLRSESDLNVQITPRVGIQNSMLIWFDNQPEPGEAKTKIQFMVNFAFSLTRGAVPQP